MKHFVRQHEVSDTIIINIGTEVFVVATRETSVSNYLLAKYYVVQFIVKRASIASSLPPNPMVCIKYACNAIKPETIELIFIHPKTQITQ